MRQNKNIKRGLYCFLALLLVILAAFVIVPLRGGESDPYGQSYEDGTDGAAQEDAETKQPAVKKKVAADSQQPGAEERVTAVDTLVLPEEETATTYTLVVIDGCLQVYVLETGSFYMETAIVYELLPEEVQEQIDAGKYFDSEEALFGFLESYSS